MYSFFGTYSFILRHPPFLKQVMIKDFDNFVNRDSTEEHRSLDKYFGRTVLMMRDQQWRDMRSFLSPIFTSSKMKYMYSLLTDSMDEFVDYHAERAKANGNKTEIDTHDAFARVTADGIATTALGFKGDCIRNKESEIFEIAELLDIDGNDATKWMAFILSPKIYKLLGKQLLRKGLQDFFQFNVLNEIKRRREGNITRPDVVQLLVQAKEGKLKLESGDADELSYLETKIKKIANWTDEDLIAQAVIMFSAGFSTTATLMQTMCFELAKNSDIQQDLIEEVDEMQSRLNGETISYEQLHGMKFLDMVVNETLRKWPSFRFTARFCNKDTVLTDEETGENFKIKKGLVLGIPIRAIQMDSNNFPSPEKFDPYRFSEENKNKIKTGSFIPFGMGPRNCIGSRYALLEAKLLLFSIISKFSIETNDKTPEKLTATKANTGYEEKIFITLKLRK